MSNNLVKWRLSVAAGVLSVKCRWPVVKAVLDALLAKGVDAHHFDPKNRYFKLRDYDRVFSMLHGTFGERSMACKGVLNGFNIPYTGCGVLASAIAMDKFRNRLVWQALDLPNAYLMSCDDNTGFTAIEQQLGLPLFIKPPPKAVVSASLKLKKRASLPRPPTAQTIPRRYFGRKSHHRGEYACSILGDEYCQYSHHPNDRVLWLKPNTIVMIPSTAMPIRFWAGARANHATKSPEKRLPLGAKGWSRVDFYGWPRHYICADSIRCQVQPVMVWCPMAAKSAWHGFLRRYADAYLRTNVGDKSFSILYLFKKNCRCLEEAYYLFVGVGFAMICFWHEIL